MKLFIRTMCFIILSALVSACSFFSNPSNIQGRDKTYLQAHSVPPIRIPPGMSSSAFQNYYPVSDHNYPDKEKIVNIVPPGLNS